MERTPRRLIGILIATAVLAVVPASAQAMTLSGLVAQPASTQAGAHSNFHLHMDFNNGQVKDLTVGLPPGQVGDPNATPQCTEAQLNSASAGNDGCPANTQVGAVVANATITVAAVPVTLDVSGKLYNLTPHAGEPARFGIVLQPGNVGGLPLPLPPVILQSAVQLRPDFGLNTIINDIPNSTQGLPTTINSQDITLFGTAPGTGKPFMRNPTSCDQHTTTFTAVPYSGSTASGSASFTPSNCGGLDFSPSFSAIVGGASQGSQTTAITSIDQDSDEAGLINAHVFVPADLAPNTLTDLLSHRCPEADFQAGTCLGNTVVGNAIATSPLLSEALAGQVLLVESGGLLPNIGLDLRGQLHLLLQGSLNADKSVTFGDVPPGLPDIPISHFQLAFTNPPGLLIANRDLCAGPPPVFHADFTGYNGATTSVDSPATVQGSCGAGTGGTTSKCKKKAKKKHKPHAAESKKHKKSCKKKKRKKH
jgi:hypothetical protein